MATQTNAEEMAKFKSIFTKERIQEYFGGTPQAIAFFEIQLLQRKNDIKEITKRFAKQSFFDKFAYNLMQQNQPVSELLTKVEASLIAELNKQIELLQSKIAFLKSVK